MSVSKKKYLAVKEVNYRNILIFMQIFYQIFFENCFSTCDNVTQKINPKPAWAIEKHTFSKFKPIVELGNLLDTQTSLRNKKVFWVSWISQ